MDVSKQPVLILLSLGGRRALGRLVPKKGAFSALALSVDSVGVWILSPRQQAGKPGQAAQAMLVKWEHIATLMFELKPESPHAKVSLGFVS